MFSGNDNLYSKLRIVKVSITIDAHESDNPSDIDFAAEWLCSKNIIATFFVPSIMLCDTKYRASLLRVRDFGHEIGSHGHLHIQDEVISLVFGSRDELNFLEKSKMIYEDFFGYSPKSFRSPSWCKLNSNAIDKLCDLGYCVDSSSTPGRLGVFTSFPYHPSWTMAPRSCWFLKPGLLEIPTSTFILPAGTPTFLTLRKNISIFMLRLLTCEAKNFKDRALVVQFHSEDFNPNACDRHRPAVSWRDCLLSKSGGFRFKSYLRMTQSFDIAHTCQKIISFLSNYSFLSIYKLYEDMVLHSSDTLNFDKK